MPMNYRRIAVSEMDTLWELHKAYKAAIGEDAPKDQDRLRLKAAMETIQSVPGSLTDFALKYDEKGLTPAHAIQFMNELSVSLSAARQSFQGLRDTAPMAQLDEYAAWIMDSISTFLAKSDTMNTVECGAAVKHFQIESIIKYNILVKDIE